MLFTSALFAWVYLPLVVGGFFLIGRWSQRGAALWLFLASVAFYSVWMPEFTALLMASIVFNFWVGRTLSITKHRGWLILGVAVNILVLAYFKYANFFVDNLNVLLGREWSLGNIILPLGISFFTFTQIAFLADSLNKEVREPSFVHYGLFVTFFPHLVAGPVLHHAQMMPQFSEASTYRFQRANFALGLVFFLIGLIKKVVLADGISPYADAVFNGADQGIMPTLTEAWLGSLAYALQLYFDFSGYSDMAVGLSWMLNIRLPFNFDSPYRATNISQFWRRWHISLSNFLRDYLYIVLGGNRRGTVRRYINLLTTMVLGGLWHGASWSFVLWGTLHGLYLVVHQLWSGKFGGGASSRVMRLLRSFLGWLLTMLVVLLAWVLFRAVTLEGAWLVYSGMVGAGRDSPQNDLFWNQGLDVDRGWWWCALLMLIAVWPANSNQIGQYLKNRFAEGKMPMQLIAGACVALSCWLITINNSRDSVGAFIYFNF